MRRSLLMTLGTTLVVLALPMASAGGCIADMDLLVDVGVARFDMEQVFDEDDAAEIRGLVDEGAGNGDGQISDSEVTAWESAMSGPSGPAVGGCIAAWSTFGLGVRQAGTAPEAIESLRANLDLQGERSATSEDTLLLRFTGTLRFAVDGTDAPVTVTPETFEGLSEMIECMSPDHVESNYAQHPCGDSGSDPMATMRLLAIRPGDGTRIDGESIQPTVARDAFDGTAILLRDFVAEDTLTDVRFRVEAADTIGGIGDTPVALIAAAAAGAAGLAGLGALVVNGIERVRFRFWWLLSVFGFTRIRREKALQHRRRESILAAIQSEPGVHLGALQRGLGMATGTLVHHLRVLERAELVEAHRRSNRVHFVPAGHQGPVKTTQSMLQVRLLDTMRRMPGLTQSELAERLEEPRNTVAYNVRRLLADGHVEVQREGRVVRHFVAEQR